MPRRKPNQPRPDHDEAILEDTREMWTVPDGPDEHADARGRQDEPLDDDFRPDDEEPRLDDDPRPDIGDLQPLDERPGPDDDEDPPAEEWSGDESGWDDDPATNWDEEGETDWDGEDDGDWYEDYSEPEGPYEDGREDPAAVPSEAAAAGNRKRRRGPDLTDRLAKINLPHIPDPDPRALMAIVAVVAAALAVGYGTYRLGGRSGADPDLARIEGEAAGREAGAIEGASRGYPEGYRRGRERGFARAYRQAYRIHYKRAFEQAGLDVPKAADIDVPAP